MTSDEFPTEVIQLKNIGNETTEVLLLLSKNLSLADSNKILPSEDPAVLDTLNSVMEKIKVFKAQVELVRQRNNNFMNSRLNPNAAIQINFIELLDKIQAELESLELESASIRSKLSLLTKYANLNTCAVMESAKHLALTSRAPPDWNPNTPLWPYRPPYPTEDLIRSSDLFMKMSTGENIDELPSPTEDHAALGHVNSAVGDEFTAPSRLNEDEDVELLRGLDIASL